MQSFSKKKLLVRQMHNIKIDGEGVKFEGMDWINLEQDRNQ
jgi:hypothetical protein